MAKQLSMLANPAKADVNNSGEWYFYDVCLNSPKSPFSRGGMTTT